MSSIVLIQSTQGFVDLIGDAVQVDGYFGYTNTFFTVAITTQNFIGKIYIEASLVANPTNNDWFPVQVIPSADYIQYPQNPAAPTGLNNGDTSRNGYSFRGNFLYLRARISRSYLYNYQLTDPYYISLLGTARIVLSQTETVKTPFSANPNLSSLPSFNPQLLSQPTITPITPAPVTYYNLPANLTNIGSGFGIYVGLSSSGNPQFRTLQAGQGLSIIEDLDTLTFNVLGSPTSSLSATTSFADAFTQLNDVPASYVGNAGKVVAVNSSENGLLFSDLTALASTGLLNNGLDVLSVARGGTGLSTVPENGILIGSGSLTLSNIQVPVVANSLLSWNGADYEWIAAPSLETSDNLTADTLTIISGTSLNGATTITGPLQLSGSVAASSPITLSAGGTSLTVENSDNSSNIATTAFVNSFVSTEISNLVEKSENLADLSNISLARINLGLGQAATMNIGDSAGTVADAGDMIARDAEVLAEAMQYASNTSLTAGALENVFASAGVSGGEYY